MKCNGTSLATVSAIFAFGVLFSAIGQPADLATVKFQYESSIASVHASEMADRAELAGKYTNALNGIKLAAQQAGDLDKIQKTVMHLALESNLREGTLQDGKWQTWHVKAETPQ